MQASDVGSGKGKKMSGMFIVFEGIDGTGKSTVCRDLYDMLVSEGRDAILTAEPTKDEIGMLIRSCAIRNITPETEALLFVADRADHTVKIREWVRNGSIVLCDRYYASTLAYQSVTVDGPGLDMDWLISLNEPVIIEPDITFLLDVSPEVGMERVNARGQLSKFESTGYLSKVRENYLKLARERKFVVIDADRPLPEMFNEIFDILKKRMK